MSDRAVARTKGSKDASTNASSTNTRPTRSTNKRQSSPSQDTSRVQKKPRGNSTAKPKRTPAKRTPAKRTPVKRTPAKKTPARRPPARRAPPIAEVSEDDLLAEEEEEDDNGDDDAEDDIDSDDDRIEKELNFEEDESLRQLRPMQAHTLLCAEMPRFSCANNPHSAAPSVSTGTTSESSNLNSKHSERYNSEIPHWADRHNSEARSLGSENSAPSTVRSQLIYAEVNAGWPTEAHYTPPGRSRLISKKAQPAPLYRVLDKGEDQALKMCLEQSFFIIHDTEFSAITAILINIAEKLSFSHLVLRFRQDPQLCQHCGRMISHRLSLRRSRLKSIAWPIVGMRFGFEDPDAKAEWIKATASNLIQEAAYIFPVENNNVVKTRPYEHPAIIQTLAKFLFNENSRGPTIGDTYPELFRSTYPEFPDQREVPLSILALASTAVHNSVSDWTTGVRYPSDFASDIIEDVFNGHKDWLLSVQDKQLGKYHAMAHRIYKLCRNGFTLGSGVKEGISKLVDLDGMEDAM